MGERVSKTDWVCINCSERLGGVFGGEFFPAVDGRNIRTNGPNLVITCPKCQTIKTWYLSDPVVRAVYQLVSAIADVAAKSMVEQIGKAIHNRDEK
jgi:hypothetical protein